MGLFSKKLTSTQEAELEEFATTLYGVHQLCEQAFHNMQDNTGDLYSICRHALQEDRKLQAREPLLDATERHGHYVYIVREETVDIDTLTRKARGAIQAYTDLLTHTQAVLSSLKPANWYPKKYKKAYNSWNLHCKSTLQYLEAAAGALQPPEPLKHDPKHGNDKLNVFAWALNSIAMWVFYQETLLPADLRPKIGNRRT